MTAGDDENGPQTPGDDADDTADVANPANAADAANPANPAERMNFEGDVQNVFHINHVDGGIRTNSGSRPAEPAPVPQQLPPEASEFHNHHDILAALSNHPQDRPQVEVIVGPPGVGKSALAVHWANLVGDRFKDGRIYLDLRGAGQGRPLTDAEAFGALFTSLEYDLAALPSDPERLAALWRTATHERSLLVLLDNAADARQVVRLLPNGPRTTTLITSRNALTELSALSGVRTTRLTLLEPDDAVSLLRRLIEPTRGPVDHHELAELAKLCGHLQLAVRVAAHRLLKSPLLTVEELNTELSDEDRILEPVRIVFDSAYRHLNPDTALLFRLLGLAPGSDLSLECVAALAGQAPGSAELRDRIDELCAAHLLTVDGRRRLLMHDLLQAYASELVEAEPGQAEADRALERLGRWYTAATWAAASALGSEQTPDADTDTAGGPEVPAFRDAKAAQDWHRLENVNLALVADQLATRGEEHIAIRLCRAAVELYAFNNAPSWRKVAQAGLELAVRRQDVDARAWFHESLGKLHTQTGDLDTALAEHESALELRRRMHDDEGITRSLNAIGLTRWRRGEAELAERSFTAALNSAREHGIAAFEIFALMNLGMVELGRAAAIGPDESRIGYAAALAHLDRALALLGTEEERRFYRVNILYDRAVALAGVGDPRAAVTSATEAVTLARALANPLLLASALLSLAHVERATAHLEAAADALRESVRLFRSVGAVNRADEAQRELDGLDGAR